MIELQPSRDARGFRFAVVVARFNDFVTVRLRKAAVDALTGAGVLDDDITVVPVPGSFEIALAARKAAETGRFDAVICLGCLIRGATPHFEYIASATAHGITSASAATGVPMTFGVLTTNSVEEALERAGAGASNKGHEAAVAAIELVTVLRRLAHPESKGVRV
ncbi:MAG: 6,7-dimethyl-8-ribityllumazine synthase [Acidobacteria bacterium]|nr:6,7-dimethyl-8-ribityllumazine synthase [Acidobacteriota bacterium]